MFTGAKIPPSGSTLGLTTPKGPTGSAVRAPSVLSTEKQERLEALRNERLRIMQAQASLMARPRSVGRSASGTPFGRPLATPPPIAMANVEEIDKLKSEIRQLKINEELSREKIRDLEAALREGGSSSADEEIVRQLKQQLAKERERIAALSSEKQRLEEELRGLKVDKFRAEQLEHEVKVLRNQLADAGSWKEDRDDLTRTIDTLKKENEAARNQYKSEKSQRLVLAARIEELEKELKDSMDTSRQSFAKRPTVLAEETVGVIAFKGPSPRHVSTDVSPRASVKLPIETRKPEVKRVESFVDPFAAGETDEYLETPQKEISNIIEPKTNETSFLDVEQRGSAKKLLSTKEASGADLASIFGSASPDMKPESARPLPLDEKMDSMWGGQETETTEEWNQVPETFQEEIPSGLGHTGFHHEPAHNQGHAAHNQGHGGFHHEHAHNHMPGAHAGFNQAATSHSNWGHEMPKQAQPQQSWQQSAPATNQWYQPAVQQTTAPMIQTHLHPTMKQTIPGRPSPASSPKEAPVVIPQQAQLPQQTHPAFGRPQQPFGGPFGAQPQQQPASRVGPSQPLQQPPAQQPPQQAFGVHPPQQQPHHPQQFQQPPVASRPQFQQQPGAQQPQFHQQPSMMQQQHQFQQPQLSQSAPFHQQHHQQPPAQQFGSQPHQAQVPHNPFGATQQPQFRQPQPSGPFRY